MLEKVQLDTALHISVEPKKLHFNNEYQLSPKHSYTPCPSMWDTGFIPDRGDHSLHLLSNFSSMHFSVAGKPHKSTINKLQLWSQEAKEGLTVPNSTLNPQSDTFPLLGMQFENEHSMVMVWKICRFLGRGWFEWKQLDLGCFVGVSFWFLLNLKSRDKLGMIIH